MMILDRYIAKTIAYVTLLVMVVLLALFSFSTLVNELEDVGQGGYTIWMAMQYVAMSMPRMTYQLFPSVALLGSMIALGILASNSELLVMRTAGISLGRIVLAVMKVGVLMAILAIILGEIIAPPAERYAQNVRSEALSKSLAVGGREGFWARDRDNFVHIREVYTDGSLGLITIYKIGNDLQLHELTTAKQAKYVDSAWMLDQIKQSSIEISGVETQQSAVQTRQSLLNPDVVNVVSIEPEFLTTLGLYRYIEFLDDNNLEADRYELALWKKIVSPLSTAVMVFLAIPFIFGPLRTVPISQRVLVGTFVGIGFHLSNEIVGFISLIYHFNPMLSSILPTLAFFILGLVLMKRALR
jgi:lipopolysaccharide export system permease protein